MITVINVGIEQSRNGNMLPDTMQAIKNIRRYLAMLAGGYTETNTNGGWINDKGELVEEHGKQWTLAGISGHNAECAAQYIGATLDQDTVMVTFSNDNPTFHKVTYETA